MKHHHKELKLSILEFHITKNSSLVSLSTIEEKKESIRLECCIYKQLELGKLKYCVVWNSSLPRSSSMWHFFNNRIHVNTIFFFFNFYKTQVFKTWFTQQTWVSWTRVSKKWYITTYFVNSDMLLIISAKSGKWPIWLTFSFIYSTFSKKFSISTK